HRYIISLRGTTVTSRPAINFVKQYCSEIVRRRMLVDRNGFLQSLLAKKLFRRITRFNNAIGVHQNPISRLEINLDIGIVFVRSKTKYQTVLFELVKTLDCLPE